MWTCYAKERSEDVWLREVERRLAVVLANLLRKVLVVFVWFRSDDHQQRLGRLLARRLQLTAVVYLAHHLLRFSKNQ